MTKFMINNRTDAWKTDVNLLNTSLLKYVFRLEENVPLAMSQNSNSPGKQQLELARDQLVLLETEANLWASGRQASGFAVVYIF